MKHGEKRRAEFPAKQFTLLGEFFAAYLHEDFKDEYGSVGEAAKAFLRDANMEEAIALRREWKAFRKFFATREIAEVQGAVRKLGGAWHPEGDADLKKLDVALA